MEQTETNGWLRASKNNCQLSTLHCQLKYAGMVELADSVDLGDVTLGKVLR